MVFHGLLTVCLGFSEACWWPVTAVQQGLFGWHAGEGGSTKPPFCKPQLGFPYLILHPMNLSQGLGGWEGTTSHMNALCKRAVQLSPLGLDFPKFPGN